VIELRVPRGEDAVRVWAWNGAADVRAQSLDRRPIPLSSHLSWWSRRIDAEDAPIWIVEDAGEPVGVIRIDPIVGEPFGGARARISIALAPSARGRGVGRRAIELACAAWGRPLVAEIRTTNTASLAAFEAAGFRLGPIRPGAARSGADAVAGRGVHLYLWRP
jgi:phosphinothricin acetyltransferase